ncbi:DDT domain-containing protein DDR4 [Impatiens glandulifera]|uniref:DDT domain-containing protein DDR4 n=1 Tax=Impatiens glandulifera TaxID=253017 RepID=UPI001FB16A1E|nr:DDT domain-containing protein DDR4 [Impatiens glandulifera]
MAKDGDENETVEIAVSPSEDRETALRKLRGRWELASVLNFFQVFEPQIDMETTFSAEEIESALIEPNDLLAKIHKTLLKGIPPVNKTMNQGDAWITVLCKKLAEWWPWVAEGDLPLTVNKGEEVSSYKKLDPTIRLQILKALCEIRADQHDTVHFINDALKDGTEISYFRKDKIGEENGTTYWYDGNEHIGFRLYKEVMNSESNRTTKGNSAVPPVGIWETLATDLEEFRKAVNDSSDSRSKVEMAVFGTIEAEVVPVLEKLEKKKERLAKSQQKLQGMLLKGFHNPRSTRSTRVSRPVSYTFDDYDKAINEAIQVTK